MHCLPEIDQSISVNVVLNSFQNAKYMQMHLWKILKQQTLERQEFSSTNIVIIFSW